MAGPGFCVHSPRGSGQAALTQSPESVALRPSAPTCPGAGVWSGLTDSYLLCFLLLGAFVKERDETQLSIMLESRPVVVTIEGWGLDNISTLDFIIFPANY